MVVVVYVEWGTSHDQGEPFITLRTPPYTHNLVLFCMQHMPTPARFIFPNGEESVPIPFQHEGWASVDYIIVIIITF